MGSIVHGTAVGAAALGILILAVTPPMPELPGGITNSGLAAHMIAYATLCVLICLWLHTAGLTRTPVLYAALAASVYGLFIECVQYFVPYRSFELSDILINCCAALAAIVPAQVLIHGVPFYKDRRLPRR